MSTTETNFVYTFYNNDKFSEVEIWHCVAPNEDTAIKMAKLEGIQDFIIAEVKPLPLEQSVEAAEEYIEWSPFLGEAWKGLVRELADVEAKRRYSSPFVLLQTYAHKYNLAIDSSPFIQWLRNEDGSLHVELAGNLALEPKLSNEKLQILEMLGWTLPPGSKQNEEDSDQDLSGSSEESDLGWVDIPNPYRVFDAAEHPLKAFAKVVEALVLVHELRTDDYFRFSQANDHLPWESLGHLLPAYGLGPENMGRVLRLKDPEVDPKPGSIFLGLDDLLKNSTSGSTVLAYLRSAARGLYSREKIDYYLKRWFWSDDDKGKGLLHFRSQIYNEIEEREMMRGTGNLEPAFYTYLVFHMETLEQIADGTCEASQKDETLRPFFKDPWLYCEVIPKYQSKNRGKH